MSYTKQPKQFVDQLEVKQLSRMGGRYGAMIKALRYFFERGKFFKGKYWRNGHGRDARSYLGK